MHQLAVLYDYLYRLTSDSVHFNVSSLFRSGWGPSVSQFVFSSKNFPTEIAPELTGHGLPLSKCEAYKRVYDQPSESH